MCRNSSKKIFTICRIFALRPSIFLKASRKSWNIVREWILALENRIKPSAKKRWVSFRASHLEWNLNAEELEMADCNILEKTSITNISKEITDPLELSHKAAIASNREFWCDNTLPGPRNKFRGNSNRNKALKKEVSL